MRVYQRLRPAIEYDQQLLAEFCADAFNASPDYFLRRWRLDPARGSFGVVLEDEGEIVGYLHAFERRLWLAGEPVRCAGFGNVAVSSRHRGRGHSLSLLEGALEESRNRGFEVALLYTHIPALYERVGFQTLPFHEIELAPGGDEGWRVVTELTDEDRRLYEAEHGERPGSVARDDSYWFARDEWLRAEGWRILKYEGDDGYCYVHFDDRGGIVDEATGGCARRVDSAAPRHGTWRRRLPNSAAKLGITPSRVSFVMGRPLDDSSRLADVSWANGVFWQTDSF